MRAGMDHCEDDGYGHYSMGKPMNVEFLGSRQRGREFRIMSLSPVKKVKTEWSDPCHNFVVDLPIANEGLGWSLANEKPRRNGGWHERTFYC